MQIRRARGSRGFGLPVWIAMVLLAATASARAAAPPDWPGGLCSAAITAAQARHAVPKGLLFAIGEVESGRIDPATRRITPWPWTVQAQNQGYYFATKEAAIQWVQAAQAKGVVSIDIGCMQVNLMYHPNAFKSLDEAFDPPHNADYAARFLVSLHASTGDWQQAAGLYHSETLALAIPYAQRVEDALNGRPWGPSACASAAPIKPTILGMLQQAWGATLTAPVAGPPPATPPVGNWGVLLAPRPRLRVTGWPRRQTQVLLSYAH
jgi:hypothetical protein